MRVAVITRDRFLYQKIKLTLLGEAEVELEPSLASAGGYDVYLADIRDGAADSTATQGGTVFTLGDGGDLALPFAYDSLFALLDGGDDGAPELTLGAKCAFLRGERISLTEVEHALLSVLYEAGGEYVCREELLERVWGDGTDAGVVNVYVYYLRQKLERGEKIINTSRKLGYKIDEKYLGRRRGDA